MPKHSSMTLKKPAGKRIRDFAVKARRFGWELDGVTGRGHLRWSRRGRRAFTAASPGDTHTVGNAMAMFRRLARQHDQEARQR